MPKVPNYAKEQVEKALEDIDKGLPLRAAAKKYGVPRATLQFKLKNPESKSDFGPDPYLTLEEENLLQEWLFEMSRRGFPRNAEDVLDSVQTFLNNSPRDTPFINNRPGRGWLKGFLKRHPKITLRTGEAVTQASACVSESDIRNWFCQISDEMKKCNLMHILDDPSRIFNADESGFQTCPSTGKVFAQKGEKNVYVVDKGKAKESITVLFTISADGQRVLPTIVYPYQRLPDRIRQSVPSDWGLATSSSGWMTADTFKFIIEIILHPFLVKNNVKLPILLFVDGHRSHLTYELSILAKSLQIEIFALYPNSTRILQPADVSLFRPVKQFWRVAVREFQTQNDGEVVSKQNFALVLKKVTEKISATCIINGFRACGLYPFDPNAVDYSKCLAKPVSATENTNVAFSNKTIDKVISFSKFTEIVGPEMIDKFKNIKNILQDVENNESFFILYRLWDFYTSESSLNEDNIIVGSTESEIIEAEQTRIINNTVEVENIDLMNSVSNNEEMILNEEHIMIGNMESEIMDPELLNAIHNKETEECFDKRMNFTSGNEENVAMNKQNNIENGDLTTTNFLSHGAKDEDYFRFPQNATSTQSNKTLDEVPPGRFSAISDIVVENSICNQPSCSKTNLKDFLILPAAPTRKGKRNIERLPYHISGLEYQKILEDKAKEKLRVEEEKKFKKIQREEKKQDKKRKLTEMKMKTLNKKNKPNCDSNCGECKGVVKATIKLRCCECNKPFHKSCIPKPHLIHVPEDHGDNFLCHRCFHIDNDDEISGNEDSDRENEDFLTMIRTGQQETGEHYVRF